MRLDAERQYARMNTSNRILIITLWAMQYSWWSLRPFRCALAGILVGTLLVATAVHGDQPSVEAITRFENEVRPLLAEHCQKCHGPKKQEAGLRLDSRAGLIKGGESGPAVDLQSPEQSLLLKVVGHGFEIKMPPEAKLPAPKSNHSSFGSKRAFPGLGTIRSPPHAVVI